MERSVAIYHRGHFGRLERQWSPRTSLASGAWVLLSSPEPAGVANAMIEALLSVHQQDLDELEIHNSRFAHFYQGFKNL